MYAVTESTPLAKVLGARTANPFKNARGLVTVGDLLAFWPRRYLRRESDLGALKVGQYAVVVAEVASAHTRKPRNSRTTMLEATITDGRSRLKLTFFRSWGHVDKLVPGVRAIFAGKVTEFNHDLQLAHPGYTLLDDYDAGERQSLIPIYLRVPKVTPWNVTESVRIVLDQLGDIADPLPPDVLARRGLRGRLEALRGIHTPDSFEEVAAARHRLRYEEAFVLQCVLAQRRATQSAEAATARPVRPGGLLEAFDARLPFTLTDGQRRIGEDIATEMARSHPMHRLLQGEVGSGKTVVALRAMLAAVDAGGQAALLAPTEVLAAQHHRSITAMLGDLAEGGLLGGSELGTRVTLLTGSMSSAAQDRALDEIRSGGAGIVIGTHALIQDRVDFADLALVVVDEQHRFGVEQRDALRAKGHLPPHVLVMTATPIPRTVAMTVFGDLETSTLRELPAGRAPITTHVVPEDKPHWVARAWERVAEEVHAGRQAYVVCPRIGDSDAADEGTDLVTDVDLDDLDPEDEAPPARPLRSVLAVHEELLANPVLAGLRVAMLHGRMSAEDKDAVMRAFAAGEIDVLVSTTVIEVGVDVANASVMAVLDADRFGVSQLHQLRGRVGRGGLPGLCLLFTGTDAETARTRLDAVAANTDGFELARLDLSLRREGDILGAAQSGRRNQLRFLHVLDDEDLIEQARADAFALVASDPGLAGHPRLAEAVAERVDAEQAAYLERG